MSDTESYELGLKITHAIDYARSSGEDVRPHYLRTVSQLTDEVRLDDLTTSELVALKALLIPAHSRVIEGRPRPDATPPPVGRVLRLIGNAGNTAS